VIHIGNWRYVTAGLFISYFFAVVALPFFVLVWSSLQKFYSVPSMAALSRLTLDAYRTVLSYPNFVTSFRNSIFLSISCATIIMLLSSVLCWMIVRTRMPGRWLIDSLASMPLVFPGIVLGLSIMVCYLMIDIGIYGTIWILLVAYITRFLPYGMRYNTGSMLQIHKELEESAAMSGASWTMTFRRIILPLLKPGLLAGWIYIVIVSMRELSSSILLYSPGSEVVPIMIWELWQNGQYVELSALGVMLIMALFLLVMAAQLVGRRFGIAER
jgi:iron(III) transport system permease protein